MKIRILGICDKCGGNLIKNSRGKTFCPDCVVEDALYKFSKKDERPQITDCDDSDFSDEEFIGG